MAPSENRLRCSCIPIGLYGTFTAFVHNCPMAANSSYFECTSAKSINVLGRAVHDAWIIAQDWTPVAARAEVREVISFAVFEMARVGERDPHRLAFYAVTHARTAATRHLAVTGSRRIRKWRKVNSGK